MIVSRFPYPLEKGDKLRSYHQLKELSKVYDVTLIALTDKPVLKNDIEKVKIYCHTIHLFKLSKISLIFNVLLQLLTNRPFQTGYFYSSKINATIQKILKELNPDHIYCQLIRVSEYVKNYHNCPKTLDYMDALSKGIERRIDKAPFYLKWLFKSETKRLVDYERKIFDYFENHTIISEQDREFILHPDRKKISCIPNGVDEHFFEKMDVQSDHELVFVGNLSYPPNIEASQYVVNSIMKEMNPPLRFLISGATPHSSVKQLTEKHPNVTLTGWVDDIRISYKRGKIFIAPMLIGTGLQNKLIEAMALGIPCITSPLANNAIKAVHEHSIVVAETADEYRKYISKLLNDPAFYATIAENGKKHITDHFNWKEATEKLIDVIESKEQHNG